MTEKTVKLRGWMPQSPPREDDETRAYRQLIINVVFSLHHRKKEVLAQKGMPAQPVSLIEILREVSSRVAALSSSGQWRYGFHGKRWLDRRVNEAACPKFYADGVPKIVAASAGKYEPNPALFEGVRPW